MGRNQFPMEGFKSGEDVLLRWVWQESPFSLIGSVPGQWCGVCSVLRVEIRHGSSRSLQSVAGIRGKTIAL